MSSSANAMEAAVIAQGQDLVTLGSEGRVGTGGVGGGEKKNPHTGHWHPSSLRNGRNGTLREQEGRSFHWMGPQIRMQLE